MRSIKPGSQADKAGVLLGWHIHMINDVPVPNDRDKALAERMPLARIQSTAQIVWPTPFEHSNNHG